MYVCVWVKDNDNLYSHELGNMRAGTSDDDDDSDARVAVRDAEPQAADDEWGHESDESDVGNKDTDGRLALYEAADDMCWVEMVDVRFFKNDENTNAEGSNEWRIWGRKKTTKKNEEKWPLSIANLSDPIRMTAENAGFGPLNGNTDKTH